jgi:hypothetical protein
VAKQRQGKAGVVSIAGKREQETMAKARLHAEAAFKDEPSAEAKAYVDGLLAANPEEWREHGELMREAFDKAFKGFWLGYVTKASVRHGAELLKQELGYGEAPAAERVLIDHAVLCHVRLGMVEHLYSRNTSNRMDVAEHWERRLTMAQRRFTRAVMTLARVRALLARAEQAREQARKASMGRSLAVLKQMAG